MYMRVYHRTPKEPIPIPVREPRAPGGALSVTVGVFFGLWLFLLSGLLVPLFVGLPALALLGVLLR